MADILFDARAIEAALDAMAGRMADEAVNGAGKGADQTEIHLIGIRRGGSAVADELQRRLTDKGVRVVRGDLDISFYRDDLDTIGPNPEVRPSHLPFDVSGRDIWLVDDVLYTGRTVRAALGEIFDYGRPARVRLVVLLDRGGRELPIAADIAGLYHAAGPDESLKLRRDGDWRIELRRVPR